MGGSVSSGIDNDDLIDNLIEANYIRTSSVEEVFRTVDRAFYFLPEFRHTAYRDMAWKYGNLHLSAPCIYSEVLEHLRLEPGRSFLNIGSGTGYLSTMAGLILGPYGINHGIEIASDVVDYAYEKLEEFKKTNDGLDMFEFCEPYFAVGNGFDLSPDRKYDRIYCGAACPQELHEHIKRYLKVHGILIVPCEEDLLKIVRESETAWEVTSVLSVSFSTLQAQTNLSRTISLPEPEPLSLQELCRSKIRCVLRDIAEKENPSLKEKPKRAPIKQELNTRFRNRVILNSVRRGAHRSDLNNVIFHNNYGSLLFSEFMRNLRRDRAAMDDLEDLGADSQVVFLHDSESDSSESEDEHDSSNSNTPPNQNDDGPRHGIAVVTHTTQDETDAGLAELVSSEDEDDEDDNDGDNDNNGGGENNQDIEADLAEISTAILGQNRFRLPTLDGYSSDGADADTEERQVRPSNKVNQNVRRPVEEEDDEDDQPKKLLKREKLDSGISEESDEGKVSTSYESSFSESTFSENMDVESDDLETNSSEVDRDNSSKNLPNEEKPTTDNETRPHKYRLLMEEKIQCLPLPQRLKLYLNHEREFRE